MVRTLVTIYILMAAVFAGLFIADLQGYFKEVPNPVAVLKSAEGTVRRLGSKELTWSRVSEGSYLGWNDTISTGEGARAKLAFLNGGAEVVLEPGAMVVLGGDVKELKLNFVSGSGRVRVAKKSQANVKVTRETYDSKAAAVKVAAKPAASSRHTAAVAALKPGQTGLNIADELVGEIDPVVVEQVDELPTIKAPTPAELKNSVKQAAKPESESIDAEKPITKALSEKAVIGKKGVLSAAGKELTVETLPPLPVVTFPPEDAVIEIKPTVRIPAVQWVLMKPKDGNSAPTSHFEISIRSPDQPDHARTITSSTPYLSVDKLGRGKLIYEVRSVTKDGKRSLASKARALEVKYQARIAAPTVMPVKVE
ncbi:MAG: hypothetical protein AB7P04_04660 [Bacteriovoracia bacterium]